MILLSVVEGQGQCGNSGAVLNNPYVVLALNEERQAVVGANINFTVVSGTGQISVSKDSGFVTTLNLVTDGDGKARIYLKPSGSFSAENKVSCSCSDAATVYMVGFVGTYAGEVPQSGGIANYPDRDKDADIQKLPLELPTPTGLRLMTIDVFSYPAGRMKIKNDQLVWEKDWGGGADATAIKLSWNSIPSPGDGSYKIEYRLENCFGGTGGWSEIYRGLETSYTPTQKQKPKSGQNYMYRVYAVIQNTDIKSSPCDPMRYEVPLIKYTYFDYGGLYQTTYEDWYAMGEGFPRRYFSCYSSNGGSLNYYGGTCRNITIDPEGGEYPILPEGTISCSFIPELQVVDAYGKITYNISGVEGTLYRDTVGTVTVIDVLPEAGYYLGINTAPLNSAIINIEGNNVERFMVKDAVGNVIGSGDSFTSAYSGTIYVTATEETLVGDKISIRISGGVFEDPYGFNKVAHFTFASRGKEKSLSLGFNMDEASGARYRKIALNGLPMSDEKPQAAAESDREKEESYVDALTLGLRHSTTDDYQAVSGADFALSVRRDYKAEVWNCRSGMRPHEEPARPFGLCWTSNLCSYIQFVKSNNPMKNQPDRAYVVDENGGMHVFADIGGGKYFPMPTSQNEQQTPNLESLVYNGSNYVFKRKYGSTLIFETAQLRQLTREVPDDRISAQYYWSTYSYARLQSVRDRMDNVLNYQYENGINMIPKKIVTGAGQQIISIKQDTLGRVTDIWNANGQKTHFDYKTRLYTPRARASGAPAQLPAYLLERVTAADGSYTDYDYELVEEQDVRPCPPNELGQNWFWHAELIMIRDANGNRYDITYTYDHSKKDYLYDSSLGFDGYYVKCGLPRNVAVIQLPDGSQSHFENCSEIKLDTKNWDDLEVTGKPVEMELIGTRQNRVVDASGQARTYGFTNAKVVFLPQLRALYGDHVSWSNVVCYQSMMIDYEGLKKSELFEFDVTAGMALSRVVDLSGNETTYSHTDTWQASEEYEAVMGKMTGASFNGNYNDPTAETRVIVADQ